MSHQVKNKAIYQYLQMCTLDTFRLTSETQRQEDSQYNDSVIIIHLWYVLFAVGLLYHETVK